MWNVKTKQLPVTTGTTGTISKSLRKYLSNVKHEVKELQQTSHIGHFTHTAGSTGVAVQNI